MRLFNVLITTEKALPVLAETLEEALLIAMNNASYLFDNVQEMDCTYEGDEFKVFPKDYNESACAYNSVSDSRTIREQILASNAQQFEGKLK